MLPQKKEEVFYVITNTGIRHAASTIAVHQSFHLRLPGARQDHNSLLSCSMLFCWHQFYSFRRSSKQPLLALFASSAGAEWWGGKRNTETSDVGIQNAFSLSFHLQQV